MVVHLIPECSGNRIRDLKPAILKTTIRVSETPRGLIVLCMLLTVTFRLQLGHIQLPKTRVLDKHLSLEFLYRI